MSNTDPQLEFNFTNKRPFLEVPRLGGKTKPFNQRALQVEGVFVFGDPHPEFEGLFCYKARGKRGQEWVSLEVMERHRVGIRKWQQANNEKEAVRKRKWRRANPEKHRACSREWHKENPEKSAANGAKRRKKLKTNIKLHKTAKNALHAVYKLCKTLTLCSKGSGSTEAFEVDHIWPIQHDEFCGLHAPWNVQILELKENRRKSNTPPLPC